MKLFALFLALLLALPALYAEEPAPTPLPTLSPSPLASQPFSLSPAPSSTAESLTESFSEEAENSPKMKEKINLADSPGTDSLEVNTPSNSPDPEHAEEIQGLLPGEEKPTPLPPVTGTVDVTAKDNNKTVRAAVGELIRITLESRPSTGYNWELRDYDFGVTVFNASDLVARQDGNVLFGAAGDTVITLQAVEAGDQDIHLVYRRPWEPLDQAAATFSFHLIVSHSHDASPLPTPPSDSSTPPENPHESTPTP